MLPGAVGDRIADNPRVEHADVVIVGARLSGCATAIPLARAGRRVVALDQASFPSNTISTHGLWPGHLAELQRLGALQRVLDLDPPKLYWLLFYHLGLHVRERGRPVDGIDYGLCVPRPQLDAAVQEVAREAGADVRERVLVNELLWQDGRVAGVRCTARNRPTQTIEIRAPLVVGADGRRSTVAELVGSAEPYRGSRNGRGFVYWYMDDPKLGTTWRNSTALWQVGETHTLVMPTPDDRMCVTFMGPAEHVALYRSDTEGMWEQTLRQHRHLAERVAGADNCSSAFTVSNLTAFFRASSGPGWALVGDAGHFKDPVIGQGIRDSLQFGRRLGERVAEILDEPRALDRALREWERERDRAALPTYHWANRQSHVDPEVPLLAEALRTWRTGGFELGDMFSRVRRPEEIISPGRASVWLVKALARPGADRRAILRMAGREVRIDSDYQVERLLGRFRPTRRAASERDGWTWPPGTTPARAPAAGRPARGTEARTTGGEHLSVPPSAAL